MIGTTSLTKPYWKACCALISFPVIRWPKAALNGVCLVKRKTPPAPEINYNFASGNAYQWGLSMGSELMIL